MPGWEMAAATLLSGLFGGGGGGSSRQQEQLYALIQQIIQQYGLPGLAALSQMAGLSPGMGADNGSGVLSWASGQQPGQGAQQGATAPQTGAGGKPLAPGQGGAGGALGGFTPQPGFSFLTPQRQAELETGTALDELARSQVGAQGDLRAGTAALGQNSASPGLQLAQDLAYGRARGDIRRAGVQRASDLQQQRIYGLLGALPGVGGQAAGLAGQLAQQNQFNALQNAQNWGGIGNFLGWTNPNLFNIGRSTGAPFGQATGFGAYGLF